MPTMESIQEKIDDFKKQRQILNDKIKESAKTLFTEFVGNLFEVHPKLVSFSWEQYTPYFNDGDECVFSARVDYPGIQFGDEAERESYDSPENDYIPDGTEIVEGWNGRKAERTKYKKVPIVYEGDVLAKRNAAEDVMKFLAGFDNDVLKSMFGDHTAVIVSKNEGGEVVTSTEECEHD